MELGTKLVHLKLKCEVLKEMLVLSSGAQGPLTPQKKQEIRFLRKVLANTCKEIKEVELGREMEQIQRRLRAVQILVAKVGVTDALEESGGVDFFTGLPVELLEAILEKVEDANDLVNCSKVCKVFQEVLKPTRTIWKLHEILPLIGIYIENQDLVNCRLVCKGWKRQLDNYIAEFPCLVKLRCNYEGRIPAYQVGEVCVNFGDLQRVEDFKEGMEKHTRLSGNPFVGRRVKFESDSEEYWETVKTFLEQFGEHIWQCEMHLGVDRFDTTVNIICNCLIRLPNLRELMIEWIPSSGRIPVLSPEVVFQLPVLHHLVSLDFYGHSSYLRLSVPSSVSVQLKNMSMTSRDFDNLVAFNRDFASSGLHNLTSLLVVVDEDIPDWNDLSNLTWLKSPLKKLTVFIRNKPSSPLLIQFRRILPVWQHFNESLEHVKFGFMWRNPNQRLTASLRKILKDSNELYLPHVKVLELTDNFDSLNFLMCFPALKHLELRWTTSIKEELFRDLRDGDGELIKIYGYLDRLYLSNIWTLLPALQGINFYPSPQEAFDSAGQQILKERGYEYTRSEYERVLKNGS